MIKNYPKYDSGEILRIIELLKYPEQSMYCHKDLPDILIDILEDYVILTENLEEDKYEY